MCTSNIVKLKYSAPITFKANSNDSEKMTKDFIEAIAKTDEKKHKPSMLQKLFWSETALYAVGAGLLGYEIYLDKILKKLKKTTTKKEVLEFEKKQPKRVFAALGIGFITIQVLQGIFKRNHEKHKEYITNLYNQLNTSSQAKYVDTPIYSGIIGAFHNPIDNHIEINNSYIDDPYGRLKIKGILKHELMHAKQFETIACSEDGIKKLNFALLMRMKNNISKNMLLKVYYEEMCKEVTNDDSKKYDDKVIILDGAKVNFKDYITAINILMTNKNATYNDIPMVINERVYKEVVDKRGKLASEEEEKAQKYFEAEINYPKLSMFTTLNPFSKYYNNLLEKEAYQVGSPRFAKFLNFINKPFNN